MEVGRKGDRRSEQIQIFRLCISTEWKSTGTCKRQSKKSRRSNEECVGNREKIVRKRYQEKVMDDRCNGIGGNELRCGNMGMEGEGKDGENARKICKMGDGGGLGHTGIYGERRSKMG